MFTTIANTAELFHNAAIAGFPPVPYYRPPSTMKGLTQLDDRVA